MMKNILTVLITLLSARVAVADTVNVVIISNNGIIETTIVATGINQGFLLQQ